MSAQAPPVLRPLNIADILDTSIRLYRQNFAAFLGITAVVYIPVTIAQMAFAYATGSSLLSSPGAANSPDVLLRQLATMWPALASLIIVSMLAVPLAQGALAIAVSRRYLNEPVTVADAYSAIGPRWSVLILTALLVGLIEMLGLVMCAIPCVYVSIIFLFVTPIIVIEGLGVTASMGRSVELVRDEWWRCFWTCLLLGVIVALVAGIVSMPLRAIAVIALAHDMALAQAVSAGIQSAITLIVQPVASAGLVLLYYDLRIRKEGFDLELLAKSLGSPIPPKAEPASAYYPTGDLQAPPPPGQQLPNFTPPPPPPVGNVAEPLPVLETPMPEAPSVTPPPPPPPPVGNVAEPLPQVPFEQLPIIDTPPPAAPPSEPAQEGVDEFKP
jgi:hypothetical protein